MTTLADLELAAVRKKKRSGARRPSANVESTEESGRRSAGVYAKLARAVTRVDAAEVALVKVRMLAHTCPFSGFDDIELDAHVGRVALLAVMARGKR